MACQGGTPSLLVTGVMWSPGIAAILTCLVLRRPISSLPWRWGRWRWNWYAWLLPIAYGFVIYLPVWVFGLGGSGFGNVDTLSNWTNQVTGGDEPNIGAIVTAAFILATIGMVSATSRALGEEIGWRGFMIWEMRKVMPFWAIGLVSGLIWAIWHWPAILFTDYNAGEGTWRKRPYRVVVIKGHNTAFKRDNWAVRRCSSGENGITIDMAAREDSVAPVLELKYFR